MASIKKYTEKHLIVGFRFKDKTNSDHDEIEITFIYHENYCELTIMDTYCEGKLGLIKNTTKATILDNLNAGKYEAID